MIDKRVKLKTYISIGFIAFVCTVWSGKIKRAFEALEVYNYFEAKRLFEKAEDRYPVASSYGLSIIYQRTDNPFTNIDSAYSKINKSINYFPQLKEKHREKYLLYGIDSLSLISQRNKISGIMFKNAAENNTVKAYNTFAEKHPWSEWKDTAIYRRDSLAFEKAITEGKADGFKQFLKEYPNSVFSTEAKSSFDRLLYVENTSSDNFSDYLNFLEKHPQSPYRPDAEDRIYEISTRTGTRDAYERFIRDFPDNHNVKFAWKKLLNTSLQEEYSVSSLNEFKKSFPDYPFTDELEKQLKLVEVTILPVLKGDKWGFISIDQSHEIPMKFDEVLTFSEGLAIVSLDEKYGYIDKLGQLVIPAKFDDALEFHEGHAIIEKDGKWGMINRSGEYTVEPIYEDLGNLENGLAYFLKDELYGYFDQKGIVRIKPQYTDAYDFVNDRAVVSKNDYYGVIDPFGTTYIPFKYEDLAVYDSVGRYKARLRSNWGIINEKGDTLAPFIYDYIGSMYNSRALVDRGGEFNYIRPDGSLLLSQWIPNYPESRQLAKFNNGHARIQYENGYNLIDTSGKKLYSRNQADIGEYGELIAVKKGQHWGYLNHSGSMVIPNVFSMARSFERDYGIAGEEPLWGLVNKKGEYAIEPYFEELSFLNDSLLLAKSRGNYGILTVKGDTLLRFSYHSIEPFNAEVLELSTSDEIMYYHLNQKNFIRREE